MNGCAEVPCDRWVPSGLAGKPMYVFETGGTTGVPKSRVAIEDFRIDYELFSETLPEEYFPRGSNWLMLGPSGPRRLRLAVEHLCQHRGGICFCVDLDPRWVIKLIRQGAWKTWKCTRPTSSNRPSPFLTPVTTSAACSPRRSCSKRLPRSWRTGAPAFAKAGITGIFAGGTEFTPQYTRFAMEELLGEGVYMTPTYGNTLMGLACSKPVTAGGWLQDQLLRAAAARRHRSRLLRRLERVVDYGKTGRVRLTTLTKETFIPGFLERDEGEREPPYEKYPWDGVSGVRPFRQFRLLQLPWEFTAC